MRKIATIQSAVFTKENNGSFAQPCDTASWEAVALPHTWNAQDGQDGGADYYRGCCWYKLALPAHTDGKRQFIEFEGANHVAQVYCNGKLLGEHRGGFSTFRFELTDFLTSGKNEISVCVDNGPDSHVYPQQADFTFFGGLYRPVHFIEVENTHFDLLKRGTLGVFITPTAPKANSNTANIRIDAFITNAERTEVKCQILDKSGACVAVMAAKGADSTTLKGDIANAQLWQGTEDPYLYTAVLSLYADGVCTDELKIDFGIRAYSVDPEKGFVLNGKLTPLHGVSRHQDRLDKGWAISDADHAEDMALIREVGANTVRLAHYQHSQTFYNLSDTNGMVLWAEIPFISVFDDHPDAIANTHSQMRELIAQNYNHPSICFWGIANEITISGEAPGLIENLRELEAIVKEMDKSRLSTIAQVSMVPLDSPMNFITDVLSYNHYFGWYGGKVEDNGPWMDKFHAENPTRPLGISEYGAECNLSLHTASPKCKDYTEEYQAYYHENMLAAFAERPYLWSTHVWNMFDFAADARDEGGCQGRNNKGLVSYDRKTKKDAFYAYKAYWSCEEFVHIAGRRFADRDGEVTSIKVYSNLTSITLNVNGTDFATLTGSHVFNFENVKLALGDNKITASGMGKNGCITQTITLKGVAVQNPDYILLQEDNSEAVRNWFADIATTETELHFIDGYYSIQDTFEALMGNEQTAAILSTMMEMALGKGMMKMAKGMMGKMLKGQTMDMLFAFAGDKLPENARVVLNEQLNKIKKS